jgi:gamma-glutamyltranspeptidase
MSRPVRAATDSLRARIDIADARSIVFSTGAADIYLRHGRTPEAGEVFRNHGRAESYRETAEFRPHSPKALHLLIEAKKLSYAGLNRQFVSNLVDHGMNLQAALDAPGFNTLTFDGCDMCVESRVPVGTIVELKRRGHEVHSLGPFSSIVGGGQAVATGGRRVQQGASDPRKDGAAIPEPRLQ